MTTAGEPRIEAPPTCVSYQSPESSRSHAWDNDGLPVASSSGPVQLFPRRSARIIRWCGWHSPALLPVTAVFFLVSIVLVAVLINVAAVLYLVATAGASLWGLVRPRPDGLTRRQSVAQARRVVSDFLVRHTGRTSLGVGRHRSGSLLAGFKY